ncbi:MAG: hypothetical protein QOE92_118 [Chloroflexota bacterium]|jgi:glycosyltransferase involved in cell wall biosynthesis|nr:hypothetical protein [Chloroflexota bacterium]
MLSVVIPCRNASAHLGELLRALAGQALEEPWEVLVVDNGSTDESVVVAEGFAGRLPLRVVHATSVAGQWYARNIGAAASRGDAIVFFDADDIPADGYLQAMRDALREADIAAADIETERLNPGWVARSRQMGLVDGLTTAGDYLPFALGACLAIRKSAFEELGGFRPWPPGVPGEDAELCWRGQLRGMTLIAAPGAVLHYRFRDTMGGIARQAVGYGVAQARLYRRFRHEGMGRESLPQALDRWRDLAARARRAQRAGDRGAAAECVYLLGVYGGRLLGSARNRVVYP